MPEQEDSEQVSSRIKEIISNKVQKHRLKVKGTENQSVLERRSGCEWRIQEASGKWRVWVVNLGQMDQQHEQGIWGRASMQQENKTLWWLSTGHTGLQYLNKLSYFFVCHYEDFKHSRDHRLQSGNHPALTFTDNKCLKKTH